MLRLKNKTSKLGIIYTLKLLINKEIQYEQGKNLHMNPFF